MKTVYRGVLIPITKIRFFIMGSLNSLRWRHNGHDGVSNHQPHHCLLNRLFGCRWTKTSKLRVTGLCAGNSPVNSPHKWPFTRKMFPLMTSSCGSSFWYSTIIMVERDFAWSIVGTIALLKPPFFDATQSIPYSRMFHFDGLAQDCSNSSALAMDLRQLCAKPSVYHFYSIF